MKTLCTTATIVAAILVFSCRLTAQNQVPNGGFETWDLYNTWTLEPEFWTTPNGQLIESVIPDSNAYEGDLAMKVTVLPGFEGGVPQQASVLFAVDANPVLLQFAVKTNIAGDSELDVVWVKIQGFKEDAQIDEAIIWTANYSISDWELVQVEIPEFSEEIDECVITVQAGETNGLAGGSWDNWISVDAFDIEITNDIIQTECNPTFYPNPLKGNYVYLDDCAGNKIKSIAIYNMSGQLVHHQMTSEGVIYIDLPPALYILSMTSEGYTQRIKLIIE